MCNANNKKAFDFQIQTLAVFFVEIQSIRKRKKHASLKNDTLMEEKRSKKGRRTGLPEEHNGAINIGLATNTHTLSIITSARMFTRVFRNICIFI